MDIVRQVRSRAPERVSPGVLTREDLRMALIVTRREVRDSFRDWRIIIPTIVLTLFFPLLMNFTAERLLSFVAGYGAEIIGTRLIPFLLLVVGFFPTSFSLVIALETFVGEKERNSLEPLLATPLTNTQLYLGKVLSSLIPPLFASFLGITVYLVGLAITINWRPTFQLLAQTVSLTVAQGLVMVSGAVIVSSQTTSTRAANLLASFIIVPMALLVQFEAVVMFWGNHAGLWWLVVALLVTTGILVRMGIHVFNREELLGRDIDQIRLGWMLRKFWRRFTGRRGDGRYPGPIRWYRQTLSLLPRLKAPLVAVMVALVGAAGLGAILAQRFPFSLQLQGMLQSVDPLQNLTQIQGLIPDLPLIIFVHNMRVVLLAVLLGTFTFGVMSLVVFMLPWTLITYLAAQLVYAGESAPLFLLGTVAPHATLELPALLLVTAAALRWQTAVIAPGPEQTVSGAWLEAGADFTRLFLAVILPLLLAAAYLEAYLTPLVARLVYGG